MSRPRRARAGTARPRGAELTAADIARAAALKRYREQAGFTQTELATMLGVSQTSLAAYEGGRTRIPDDVLKTLTELAQDQAGALDSAMSSSAAVNAEPPPVTAPAPDAPGPPAGDLPPEIAAALSGMAGGGFDPSNIDPAVLSGLISAAGRGELTDEQKASVMAVSAMYQLAGAIVGRLFDPVIEQAVEANREPIAVAWVRAAEVNPMIARIVKLLALSPLADLAVLHGLLILDYLRRRGELEQTRRQAGLEAAAAAKAAPPPQHPGPPLPADQAARILHGSPFEPAAAA